MTAHPADPVKPVMYSLLASHGAMYSEEWLSSEGTTNWTLVAGGVKGAGHSHTVDIHLVLLHELPQPGQALRGNDLLHLFDW